MPNTDPKPLADWLRNSASETGGLLRKIHGIESLSQSLRDWLNQSAHCPWASSVRVASFEGGVLTVYCDDAASLSLFRYRIPEALGFIRRRHFGSCARIDARVRPSSLTGGPV